MADPWGMSTVEAALPEPTKQGVDPPTPPTQSPDPTPNTVPTNVGLGDLLVGAPINAKDLGWAQFGGEVEGVEEEEETPEVQGWGGSARIYEWDGDMGEIGPKFPELELELFGDPQDRQIGGGIDFTKITQIQVIQEGTTKIDPIESFKTAGLHPAMLRNVELSGYNAPTPIQKFTLPAIHLGYDLIAIAQTGSGKTAAYIIPILNKLMGKAKKWSAPRPNPALYREGIDPPVRAEPLVLVVCPARELGIQIFNETRKFCYRSMLRPCVCYGGGPVREQIRLLNKGCDILISTPGRLIDFMNRPDVLSLRRLRYIVLDEADEMLHEDWTEDIQRILAGADQDDGNVKYMLFSATFPKPLRDIAKGFLANDHVRIRVGRAGSSVANIKQIVYLVSRPEKRAALVNLLGSMPAVRTIVFVNSKRVADEIDDYLWNSGLPCATLHSDRSQFEREQAMRNFRSGKTPILIATGVSARGIDVRNVMHVINFDLPRLDYGGIEEYTHRIGRTGRIGHRGVASSLFVEDDDQPMASVLTRTLMETNQSVPEFLRSYIPQNSELKFEADSDYDEEEGDLGMQENSGGGWDVPADDVAMGNGTFMDDAPTKGVGDGGGNGVGDGAGDGVGDGAGDHGAGTDHGMNNGSITSGIGSMDKGSESLAGKGMNSFGHTNGNQGWGMAGDSSGSTMAQGQATGQNGGSGWGDSSGW